MNVGAGIVGLPDLHSRVAHRIAGKREHTSANFQNLADRGCNAVVDDQEVVVMVERQLSRIIGTFRLRGCAHELLSKRAADAEERSGSAANGDPFQKLTSVWNLVKVHRRPP